MALQKLVRSLALLLLLLTLIVPTVSAAPAAPDVLFDVKGNPVTPLTAGTFADPPQIDMPWVRWNFPPATATIEELMTELQDMYDHNIAGVEIGQGGVPTTEQLVAIYNKANELGITVSLKAAKALAVGAYSGTNPYARRTINATRITVNSGESWSGLLTGPANGTIVAVLAYRCTEISCPTAGIVELERSSVQDVTSTLTGTNTNGYQGGTTTGTLSWTAPAEPAGQWIVFTFWAVPYGGGQPETLSLAGTKQVTDSYDVYFAQDGLADLVRANVGDFFVDSHASDPWGAPEELWASGMRDEFQARAGYDIVPYLAGLLDSTMTGGGFTGNPGPGPFFSFSDGTDDRVRSDFNRVRSDMYTEYRLIAFQDWAHTYNMKLRVQQEDGPYTSIADQLQTSMVLDRSEYESLTGSDQADIFRPMASANHMTGNTWFSTECCADLNESYVATTQDAIIRMSHEFAGGVSRIVYHVYPYLDTPASSWPGLGFSTAKVSFSNAWNRTEPYWIDEAALNDYFARSRQVLTQGAAKVDVAVYQRNYSSPSNFAKVPADPSNRHWMDLGLQQAGYTWDYLDEVLFDLPNAVVKNRRLAPDGPDYKALIFDQFLYPSTNTARGGLTIKAANKILEYAMAGLPIIFVGLPSWTASQVDSDTELQLIVAQILAQKSVSQVASEAEVPGKLAALGIEPQAKPAAPTTLLTVRRSDAATKTDYYWIYNQGVDSHPGNTQVFGYNPSNLYEEPAACRYSAASGVNPCMATGDAVDTYVTLEGKGAPYMLDAFSGKITPIAQYTRKGQTVTVHVKLARDASTIVALSNDPDRFGMKRPETNVTSTTADSAAVIDGSIVVRAAQAGTYKTTLDNGRTVVTKLDVAPAAIDLTNAAWQIDAEDWQPLNSYGTLGPAGTLTNKIPVSVDITGLKSWPDIPELANASGMGTYTGHVTLPAGWDSSYGATISLGQVTDSFALTINGEAVAIDQVAPAVDLGPYLQAGDNVISMRVATTYNNRLFALDNAVKNRGVIQNYGLVGPVVLTPYRQAVVWP